MHDLFPDVLGRLLNSMSKSLHQTPSILHTMLAPDEEKVALIAGREIDGESASEPSRDSFDT